MEIVTKPMESRRCREDDGDNMCVDADASLPGGQKNCQDNDDDNDDDANMKRTCQEGEKTARIMMTIMMTMPI